MLKISLIDDSRRRRPIVEGKLLTRWEGELKTAISQEGEEAILGLIKGGIRFRCSGVFTKHVVKELTRRARRNLQIRADD